MIKQRIWHLMPIFLDGAVSGGCWEDLSKVLCERTPEGPRRRLLEGVVSQPRPRGVQGLPSMLLGSCLGWRKSLGWPSGGAGLVLCEETSGTPPRAFCSCASSKVRQTLAVPRSRLVSLVFFFLKCRPLPPQADEAGPEGSARTGFTHGAGRPSLGSDLPRGL